MIGFNHVHSDADENEVHSYLECIQIVKMIKVGRLSQ